MVKQHFFLSFVLTSPCPPHSSVLPRRQESRKRLKQHPPKPNDGWQTTNDGGQMTDERWWMKDDGLRMTDDRWRMSNVALLGHLRPHKINFLSLVSRLCWSGGVTWVFSMQPQCLHSLHPAVSSPSGFSWCASTTGFGILFLHLDCQVIFNYL